MDHGTPPGAPSRRNLPQHRRDPYRSSSASPAPLSSATTTAGRSPTTSARGRPPDSEDGGAAGVGSRRRQRDRIASSPQRRRPRAAADPITPPPHGRDFDSGPGFSGGSFSHYETSPGHSVYPTGVSTYTTNGARSATVLASRSLGNGRGPSAAAAAAAAAPLPGGAAAVLPRAHHHPLFVPSSSSSSSSPSAAPDRSPGDDAPPKRGGRRRGGVGGRALSENQLNSPQLDLAAVLALFERGRSIVNAALGHHPRSMASRKGKGATDGRTDEERWGSLVRLVMYLIPAMVLATHGAPPVLDRATRPTKWAWKPVRRLDGRRCAMNLFVEKQAHDEFDPDHQLIKAGEVDGDTGAPRLPSPPKVVEGTYRTKGQMHVISRFIEAVADSFRSDTAVHQHVIFAGARDGGHLAEAAVAHWPPRGERRAQFHVIADDVADDESERALGYGMLDAAERRFRGSDNVRVYGRDGAAGVEADDDDDDEAGGGLFGDDDGAIAPGFASGARGNNVTDLPYPDLTSIVPSSEDEDAEVRVPYLHVDGLTHSRQMEVLESARPLLESRTVAAVGMERSPDLDVPAIIGFFRSAGYKTFFLGSRQIYRVDHLCEEVLEDVLNYPGINRFGPHGDLSSPIRNVLKRWGILPDALAHYADLPRGSAVTYVPFVVAMPMGRRTSDGTHNGRQEMTIQHMYDLFGGYGGGGQIKTANDRKAPGKK